MNLENAVAIITGSSSGVGAATARMLAQRGCRVTVNYSRSAAAAEAVARECEDLGAEALVCQANVADDADCRRMVSETLKKWGRLDALVNNAGTTKFVNHANLAGLDKEDFFSIYGVNVVGPYQMTRAAEDALRASGDSAIVNVSSIAGVRGVGSSIAYAASKGALINMTKSLARVLGPEIRVNCVCPGFIAGEWLKEGLGADAYERAHSAAKSRAPLKRVCTPESVAESIIGFIDGHSIITGESIILDGGQHLM
jgi:3-oxoacyl-[acyl-carrier protein] reductase